VVNGQDGERRGKPIVAERKVGGHRLHDRGTAGSPLADHRHRRLDGDDEAVGRFVRPSARAHIHDRIGSLQGPRDRCRHPRVGAPAVTVAHADVVVQLGHRRPRIRRA